MNTSGSLRLSTGEADKDLEAVLDAGLDEYNHRVTGISDERPLSVRAEGGDGALIGGLRGWTWGVSAGVSMVWIREDHRGAGVGRLLMGAAESEAISRGCSRITVSSFTFQAPEFYRRLGYEETGRSFNAPLEEHADVHFLKRL